MREWEYYKLDLSDVPRRGDEMSLLNRFGKEGWELVSVTEHGIAYLKREIVEPVKSRRRSAAAPTAND